MTTTLNPSNQDLEYSRQMLERSRQDMKVLSQLAEMVALGSDSLQTQKTVLESIVGLLRGETGYVYLLQADQHTIHLSTVYRRSARSIARATEWVDLDASPRLPISRVIRSGKGLVLENVGQDPEVVRCLLPYMGVIDFSSWVCAPLHVGSQSTGAICVAAPEQRWFGQEDVWLLEAVGNVLGVALYNARLLDELRDKQDSLLRALQAVDSAREGERKRLSRELHDEVGQSLTSILLRLKAMQQEEDVEILHDRLNGLRYLASDTLQEVRRISAALRPSALNQQGMIASVRRLVHECSRDSGIPILFEAPDEVANLPAETETILYRAIQEGITNIIKHAQASFASIRLSRGVDAVHLDITDNGLGLRAHGEFHPGSGLTGMQERAGAVGGSFAIQEPAAGGVSIHITLPLPAGNQEPKYG
ncbi:MAG: GAF domain-containing sensor histidine kinase [Anaerolineaceae bacterium]|nr:GAF domain-containing sensor histidine kinase [Anaerolineaceae bacterium]